MSESESESKSEFNNDQPYYTDLDVFAPDRSQWTFMKLKHRYACYIGSREKRDMHVQALAAAMLDSHCLQGVRSEVPDDPSIAWDHVEQQLTHSADSPELQLLLLNGGCLPLFCPPIPTEGHDPYRMYRDHGLPLYEWNKRNVPLDICRLSGWYWNPTQSDRKAARRHLYDLLESKSESKSKSEFEFEPRAIWYIVSVFVVIIIAIILSAFE